MEEKYAKVHTLNALISETNGVYHEIAQGFGLSDSAMQVLYTAFCHGGSCTVRQVVLYSGISKQTISSALGKMEAEECIIFQAVDGKQKRVCLTEKGRCLAEKTAKVELELETAILDSWGTEEAKRFLEMNRRYLDDLREGLKALRTGRKEGK